MSDPTHETRRSEPSKATTDARPAPTPSTIPWADGRFILMLVLIGLAGCGGRPVDIPATSTPPLANSPDANSPDANSPDANSPDANSPDANSPDANSPDAGPAASRPITRPPADLPAVLRLATTSSVRDSGLLDELVPVFERQQACRVDVVAVGSGAALKLGEAGDADVLIVHAPAAEQAFMAAGHATRREEFMVNYFWLLGPPDDPAQARGRDPEAALRGIAEGQHPMISRGDQSGTHVRELELWESIGGRPAWDDYVESGQGMGATLTIADEKRAYVLADQGTYLKFRDKLDLVPLVREAEGLKNPYSVLLVQPAKHPRIHARLAEAWLQFLISREGQQLIPQYTVAGESLFRATRQPPSVER